MSVNERVINDRREEIYGLHNRSTLTDSIRTSTLQGIKSEEFGWNETLIFGDQTNSMKKSAFSALFLAWAITQAAAAPEKYEINPINSFVLFKVRFLWASNISGCFCGGASGMVSFDPAVPEKSIVELDIKTDTLDTGVALLNKDIKSPEFLNVRQFHSITFKSKSVRKIDHQQYMLIGDLTFHGITKALTLRANLIGQGKDSKGESHAGADIRLIIRLSEFGVKYQLPALGDDVFLTIGVRN